MHEHIGSPKYRKKISWHINFFKLSFGYFVKLFFVLLVAVNEENSKHPQIARSVINFQGNIFIFKKLHVPLK